MYRWSIMAFERNISLGTGNLTITTQNPISSPMMAAYDDSFTYHASKILQSDEIPVIINSAQ